MVACVRGYFMWIISGMYVCAESSAHMCAEDQILFNVIFFPLVLHLCNTFIKAIHHLGFPLCRQQKTQLPSVL